MPSSPSDPRRPRAEARGTWVRLAVLLLVVVMMLLSSTVELTGALLTDTTQTSTVVSTLPEFADAG
ncbi:hypothetical protein [Cellulomonas phragmiteti]|uniref:Uncharacterized protein n=1 Tax=Cellulomonas phragmiteti TaxID=478780 RepID=A0ABQ4DM83_9CELL|nr:hypothetical protein [Cellulomonas phragmiteti]GIG40454.1 hypothetical protein Cph01nite_22160 [Cellulomonas phragmiteti]